MAKALIISELRHEHALRDLLRAAGMSRSTWYYNMNALKQGTGMRVLKRTSGRYTTITKVVMATAGSRSH